MPVRKLGVPLAECRACHEPIRFVKLDTGKAMPVNPTPSPRGNVTARVVMGRLVGFVVSKDHRPQPGADLFVPHYATCEEQRPKRPAPTPTEEPLFEVES